MSRLAGAPATRVTNRLPWRALPLPVAAVLCAMTCCDSAVVAPES